MFSNTEVNLTTLKKITLEPSNSNTSIFLIKVSMVLKLCEDMLKLTLFKVWRRSNNKSMRNNYCIKSPKTCSWNYSITFRLPSFVHMVLLMFFFTYITSLYSWICTYTHTKSFPSLSHIQTLNHKSQK
jgi:hypothetical protein